MKHIILVHGAWGDASHWNRVIPLLANQGYQLWGAQNPLTSLEDDNRRLTDLINRLEGEVLLVGHSYGGQIITAAGVHERVKGLVYVAAFAADNGETAQDVYTRLPPPVGSQSITPDEQGFLWIPQEAYKQHFCPDLSDEAAYLLAVGQRPLHSSCFGGKIEDAAWRQKPSWYQVSLQDEMINPDTQKFLAERMNAREILTLEASHASMASHPKEIAALILRAAEAVL